MELKHLISVVIPTYNVSPYLSQCLETILSQTYNNLEIIVVDDGSTDDTAQIAQRYPVKLIQQANQGAAAARNAGINVATGEYLHFIDADDLINLNFYERMLEAILSVNADMACSGYIHERLPAFTTILTEKFLYVNTEDKMIFGNVFHQGNVWKYLYKLSFLRENKLKFDVHLRNGHDKAFTIQAVYFSNKIIAVPGAIYFYKERSNSLVTSLSKERKQIRERSIAMANEFCKKFAKEHQIKTIGVPQYAIYQYKLFGKLPVVTKRVYNTGRVHWYLLGLRILQIKPIPTFLKMIP